ncbi:MAG: tetratricopeptide repeat protein [Elusimicrobia bacterium]|nr:tetratricopeptide repeat protein [Elusimicrobiota bacterium]
MGFLGRAHGRARRHATVAALALAASLALAAGVPLRAEGASGTVKSKKAASLDGWDSLKMEGSAILGELKLQSGDYSGARETFGESLETSVNLRDPSSPVMALDLYRSALLAAGRGEVDEARGHLEILINRYPDSEFAVKGRQLLALIDRGDKVRIEGEEPVELEPLGARPGAKLSRIRASLRKELWRDALGQTRGFLAASPDHELAGEARLLEGLLYLKVQPAKAAPVLTRVARGGPSHLRSRAAYLLGSAAVSLRNCSWLAEDLPDPSGPVLRTDTPRPDRWQRAPDRWQRAPDRWQRAGSVWAAACDDLSGRPESAEVKYRSVAESAGETPLKAYALAALAQAAARQQEYGSALMLMDKAVSEADRHDLDDVAAVAALSRGHLLYKLRRYREAALAYGAFAGAYPQDPNRTLALYHRALALKWAGDNRSAIQGFESLIVRFPETVYAPDARLQLGLLYDETGHSQKAVESYRRMAEGGLENRRESLLLEAQHHYNRKRYLSAIPLYWKFLAEFPDDPRQAEVATLLLTSYWVGSKDDPGFLKAAEMFPDHPIVANLRWNLAAQAHRQGDCRKAVPNLQRFEAEYPDSPRMEEGLMLKAECLYELKDYRLAADAFTELIRRYPRSKRVRDARFKKGLALHGAGDFSASAAAMRLVGGSDSLAADAAYNAALSAVKTGDKAEALASLEGFVNDFPRHPRAGWAFFKLGELREGAGRHAAAALAYGQATENRSQALFNMGRCYERIKDRLEAKKAYEALLKARPANDSHRLNGLARLGLFYELEGKFKKAAQVYADILKNAPQGDILELARKRLLALTKDGSLTTTR